MPKVIQRTPVEAGVEKASDRWRTCPHLFRALDDEFDFVLDCAADPENHLVDQWLGPGGLWNDALSTIAWWKAAECGAGFLNPPYSTDLIAPFLERVVIESQQMTLVVLVPYTPDTRWWVCTDYAVEIREIPHRVRYLQADGVTAAAAMFPSTVLVYRPQPGVLRGHPRHVVWDYPQPNRRPRVLSSTLTQLGATRRMLVPPSAPVV